MADDPTAFPTLDGGQLAALDALGTRRTVAARDYLYREGDAAYDFYVEVDIVVGSGANERVIAQHGPGRFLGELNLLTGLRVFVSARVTEPGEVIAVPVAALRHVIATQPALSDTILAAFIARRWRRYQPAPVASNSSRRALMSRLSRATGSSRSYGSLMKPSPASYPAASTASRCDAN